MPDKKIYKNDPIAEAIMEFRFEDYDEHLKDIVPASKVHALIQDHYSGETRELNRLMTEFRSNQNDQSLSTREFRERFQIFSDDKTRVVGIGKGSVTISILAPYCGWDEFVERAKFVLEKYREVVGVKPLQRVGLRYINKFAVPKNQPDPVSYLNEVSGFYQFPGSELENFMSKTDRRFEDGKAMIIHQVRQLENGDPHLILDIDVIDETNPVSELEELLVLVEDLHAKEKECFEILITDQARAIFDA